MSFSLVFFIWNSIAAFYILWIAQNDISTLYQCQVSYSPDALLELTWTIQPVYSYSMALMNGHRNDEWVDHQQLVQISSSYRETLRNCKEMLWLYICFICNATYHSFGWTCPQFFDNALQCCYKEVNLLPNPHKIHPLASLLGQGLGCILWVKTSRSNLT